MSLMILAADDDGSGACRSPAGSGASAQAVQEAEATAGLRVSSKSPAAARKRRVCRDANGSLDLGPGVSNSAFGKAQCRRAAR